jgi:TolB protein
MLLLPLLAALLQTGPYTERISLNSAEFEGDGPSGPPAFCADGRWVAFASDATDLVGNDGNGLRDVFLRARHGDRTWRISVTPAGADADGPSFDPAISADGTWTAFTSEATNLVAGDANGVADVFVHDFVTGVTARVSVDSFGGEANGASGRPAISADGRWVVFDSVASNLVAGDLNGVRDVFLHDRWTGVTARVSVPPAGGEADGESRAPRISGDGRFLVFESDASNLALDANGVTDVFLVDQMTGGLLRISVTSGGNEALGASFDADVSVDGFTVVFTSAAANLVAGDTNGVEDVFLRDRRGGITERVSVSSSGAQANGRSGNATMIPDGSILLFESEATDLVAGDTNGVSDVFLRERATAATERVSLRTLGGQANGPSYAPSCAVDARVVAFASDATNLVAGDGNGVTDVFVRNRGFGFAGTATTVVLTVQPQLTVGGRALFELFSIAPGNPWWLLGSFAGTGTVIAGHPFEVGPPVRLLATGNAGARGTARWLSPPLPPALSGRSIYAQVGIFTMAHGEIHESNMIERLVQ